MRRCPMCGRKFVKHMKAQEMCKSCGHQADQDHIEIENLMSAGHTHHCACRMVWGDGECECEKKGYCPGRISAAIEQIMGYDDIKEIKGRAE